VRYLGLFRPAKSKLSWPRVASILGELLPQIAAYRVERDGRLHDIPMAAWASALDKTIAARDAGTLRTPLKSHGYLIEIAIAEAARSGVAVGHPGITRLEVPVTANHSATAKAHSALESRRRPT